MSIETIDQVILRLDAIVEDCIARRSRLGYFAASYSRMTSAVRAAIDAGRFEQGELMRRLDVTFASRYLDAYDQVQGGRMPSHAWLLAFDAAERDDLVVFQHLYLGMNAHIHLDLGIATAEVCPGDSLARIEADFFRMNELLVSVAPTVLDQELRIETEARPALAGLVDRLAAHAGGAERWLADTLMKRTRSEAWDFARELAPLTPRARLSRLARCDEEAVKIGMEILALAPVMGLVTAEREDDVARNIRILAAGELPAKLG